MDFESWKAAQLVFKFFHSEKSQEDYWLRVWGACRALMTFLPLPFLPLFDCPYFDLHCINLVNRSMSYPSYNLRQFASGMLVWGASTMPRNIDPRPAQLEYQSRGKWHRGFTSIPGINLQVEVETETALQKDLRLLCKRSAACLQLLAHSCSGFIEADSESPLM